MQCLIVTILCCVDDHFTSFVAVLINLLLLTMVCSEFMCSSYLGKTACHVAISDWLSISTSFQ